MSTSNIVPAHIGSVEILFDSSTDISPVNQSDAGMRPTSPTAETLSLRARKDLIEILDQLRNEFHSHWERSMSSDSCPDELAVEISFAFESGVNAWVIVGKAATGVKAAFKWKRTGHQ